jgi:sodium transport system permease protein
MVGFGAVFFGRVLSLLVVIMALTASFFAALDLGAGEKERQTLETLLVSPADRLEIAVAKVTVVFTMTVVSSLVNLAAMSFTFSGMFLAPNVARTVAFSVPTVALLLICVYLVPLALLFSTVTLAVSTAADTYKEGSSYFLPLSAVCMPLAFVVMLPGSELNVANAWVPVSNVTLLFKAALLGKVPVLPAVVVFLATSVYSAIATLVTVKMYQSERLLIGGFGAIALNLLPRRARGWIGAVASHAARGGRR